MKQTPRTIALTLLDFAVQVPLYDLDSALSLIVDLENNIPAFVKAEECFFPLSASTVGCVVQAFAELASDHTQITKFLQFLANYGINVTLDELANWLLHTDYSGFVADEATYIQRTTESGTYPLADIGISGN